mmetsp:Transcript_33962/g.80094  ORF Transcript_33962/g.80094 Transcript_33962/m.80094 type:complete len:215 (+) Transcript_33962:212-856(+)
MSAASVAPARCVGSRRKSLSAGESLEGKLKTSSTRRLPNSEGMLCVGMPSSFSVSTWWGWLTPALAMVTEWPSRWRMVRVKPRSAWRSVRRSTIERSAPSRLKTRCAAVSSCSTTSPGTMPGVCSLARSNVIVAPLAMPRSTTASSVVGSSLHCSSDGTCTSWLKIMFPMRFCTVLRSAGQLGPQPWHRGESRFVRQPRHTIRLRTCALIVLPL